MTNKMTYVKALEIAMKAVEDNKEVTEKLEALKESISKKNSAERKPTATQKANEEYKKAILSFMEVGKKYTISELMKEVVELADLSNQRVSALVRQLKDSGLVERTEEKRKAYFSKKAVTENEGE
jgi:predicted transcriptional regulator